KPAAAAASDTAEAAAAAECRGQRVPHEIRIASVTPQALAAMAEQPPESQPSTEPKPPALSAAPSAAIERAFFSGNPSAGLTHGMLHLMKDTGDWGSARPSVLVMLAVPAHMTVIDLAQFVADSGSELLEMKIIRDRPVHGAAAVHRPGRRGPVLQRAKHGEPFSSLEPELTCCLAYVARVETRSAAAASSRARAGLELPTCPVCLDRLDEPLKGILTILCNHSFHLRCLDKWHEASCPVCRYVATPQSSDGNSCSFVRRHRQSVDLPDLRLRWLRPLHRRARVGTDRVWDYCGDNFVHRLVQNKADGKLVQVGGDVPDDKLDAVTLERSRSGSSGSATMAELEEARRERAALDKRLGQTNSRLQKLQKELDEERGFNSGMLANQRDLQERLQAEEARRVAELRKKEEELEQLREEMRDLYGHTWRLDSSWPDEAVGSQLVVGEQPQQGASGSKSAKKRSGRK
uniref:RING-type domain-containing protein n=1 Tax=Macrostomum lignano TaxID=282301 RepID=A0A1I8F624_9PLAT